MTDARVAVVTGAGRGLGLAISQRLANDGRHVVIAELDERNGSEAAATIVTCGGAATFVRTDIADARSLAVLAERAQSLGRVDALVNNAAIVSLARQPFEEIPEEEWDRVLEVNLKGCWLCTRAVTPLLRAAGGGSIVNLASEVVHSGSAGLAHYVASKAGIVGLTRVLARELGPDQIRVNALAPGFIRTEGATGLTAGAPYDTSATPLGRLGAPDDLLGALAFLISDESEFVTGQTLLVNGGRFFN